LADVLKGEMVPPEGPVNPFQVITTVPVKGEPFALRTVSRISVKDCATAQVVISVEPMISAGSRWRSLTMMPHVGVTVQLVRRFQSNMPPRFLYRGGAIVSKPMRR
jgi:hypothetical protein